MLGVHKATGVKVAVKVVEKAGVQNKPEMLKNEVEILSKVDHPNIISLYDIFDTKERLYLVMELYISLTQMWVALNTTSSRPDSSVHSCSCRVTGGELFERIVEREQYKESEACIVMKQLFAAIAYLHSLGIVHRDLKVPNSKVLALGLPALEPCRTLIITLNPNLHAEPHPPSSNTRTVARGSTRIPNRASPNRLSRYPKPEPDRTLTFTLTLPNAYPSNTTPNLT